MNDDGEPRSALMGEPALAADRAGDVMERFLASADVAKVYAAPIAHGDRLLIPAAEVFAAAGFGMGSGAGELGQRAGRGRRGGGSGGGGGGSTLARSVAVIVSSPEGVEVRPVIDVTKIALAALTAAGFVWAAWRKTAKPKGLFG
jgi:uncharacterized spore protein YtfJ